MNFDLFYEKCQQLPEKNRPQAEVFYKNIVDIFGASESPRFDDANSICKLFYGNGKGLSKAQFYRRKGLIQMFYEWLYEQGHVDEAIVGMVRDLRLKDVILDNELRHYYFRDLDAALKFVSHVGSANGLTDQDDMLGYKAIVILAWYGISLPRAVDIKKGDLIIADHCIRVGGDSVSLDESHFNVLLRYSDANQYKSFPTQKKQTYVNSPYLMRSSMQQHLTSNSVQCSIRRFNIVASEYGRMISVVNLKKNGGFCRILDSGVEDPPLSLIVELVGCDKPFAFAYKESYNRWKNLFVSGGD